jgi:hypothetical protein
VNIFIFTIKLRLVCRSRHKTQGLQKLQPSVSVLSSLEHLTENFDAQIISPTMAASVALDTPLAEQLSSVVQPKLVEVGWTTDGLDDSALAEYIILMLVNGKTQEQVASELSNDLLNLDPGDTGAIDFARWLFEQVDVLNSGSHGQAQGTGSSMQFATAISGDTSAVMSSDQLSQDAEMGDAMEGGEGQM